MSSPKLEPTSLLLLAIVCARLNQHDDLDAWEYEGARLAVAELDAVLARKGY